jgi:hypothetical protein
LLGCALTEPIRAAECVSSATLLLREPQQQPHETVLAPTPFDFGVHAPAKVLADEPGHAHGQQTSGTRTSVQSLKM